MNGLSKFSETLTVCTDPPDFLSLEYDLNENTLQVTFSWTVELVLYEKAILAEITTAGAAQGDVWFFKTE